MSSQQTVLVLGCGLVSPPLVDYLNRHNYRQILATRTRSKADAIVATVPNQDLCEVVVFDIEQDGALDQLDGLTARADLVVSLLPWIHHTSAAKIALRHNKHFCTASYVSDEMEALDSEFRAKDLISLNEIGVDPGLDHMSAQKVIDEVHARGGKVREFTSICGGLPAPECNDNPFGYKLSWAPRGVLLASRNSAKILRDGAVVDVAGGELYAETNVQHDSVEGVGALEWTFNRDCVKYRDIYSIPECKTLIRGTYRYPGWCRTLKAIADLSLTSLDERTDIAGQTFKAAIQRVLGTTGDPAQFIAEKLSLAADDDIIENLRWVGAFDTEALVPDKCHTALDALCHLFKDKLVYADKEQDMICMRHSFEVEYDNGARRETIRSTLIDRGQQNIGGQSSMARTVCLPLAVGVRMVLEGTITRRGVVRPVHKDVYDPILREMAELGVSFVDETLPTHLWLRAEVKKGEERTICTPDHVKQLVDAGYQVTVERSEPSEHNPETRCIEDHKFQDAGAVLAGFNTWSSAAPRSAIICGLKELLDEYNGSAHLKHRHVFFAHCFKNQLGWKDMMRRFNHGGGFVLDLEFLVDSNGRRVAAFGYAAGVAGMAVGLLTWASQKLGHKVPALHSYPSSQALVEEIKSKIAATGQVAPKPIVIGALGRCGSGAVWFAEQCGLDVTKWDMAETKAGGPFPELLEHEVFVNCVYLGAHKIAPFLTREMLDSAKERKLTVLSDVSCDWNNPNNPVPVYECDTTFEAPVATIIQGPTPFEVVSIDHLPSMIPLESSQGFSTDLLPHLLNIGRASTDPVWSRALDKYNEVWAKVDQQ